jgi:deoxyribonuclease-4
MSTSSGNTSVCRGARPARALEPLGASEAAIPDSSRVEPRPVEHVSERPFWLDGRPRIGMHTSTAVEASRALDIASRVGCTALQIFSGSPRMWPRAHQRAIRPEVAERFRARRAELRLGPLAVHANYLINLASPDAGLWERSVAAFRDELVRGLQLGAEFLIVHPGSARDGDRLRAIDSVAEGIARASRMVPVEYVCAGDRGALRVLVENTAGQGASIGVRLEELAQVLDGCRTRGVAPPPGVCLDTAHLLAAGYEIRTPEELERTLDEVDATVGLKNVRVVHVNDSKAPLGARVDRHEHIGRGHIGREAFRRILNHPRLRDPKRAFLLETPIDRPGDDRRNVRAIWRLIGMDPPAQPRQGTAPPTRHRKGTAPSTRHRKGTALAVPKSNRHSGASAPEAKSPDHLLARRRVRDRAARRNPSRSSR